jgi:glutathionylspermidine synthase
VTPSPIAAGANLDLETWRRLRLRAIFDYCKWDPHSGDQEVLARFPLILEQGTVNHLAALAEALAGEALAAEQEILAKPKLLVRLGLPDLIRECLSRAGVGERTRDVRVMRFDFHHAADGWRISEVNADVPGGYVEASGWNGLFARERGQAALLPDPTEEYAQAICATLPANGLVALAHATVYSEDRQVMVHLGRELGRRGMRVCLVSPRNLSWPKGAAFLNTDFARGAPAFVVRLSPAEWLPGKTGRDDWRAWFGPTLTPLSNPGRAIVLQSKRFALTWDELATPLPTWRRLLPETRCPSRERNLGAGEWVLKPAFGRVGEDVGIRGVSAPAEYERICAMARRRPEQWIAQKRFHVTPVATEGVVVFPCIGVYTVNGKFAGLYGRAARSPLIDGTAFDVAVLSQAARSVQ